MVAKPLGSTATTEKPCAGVDSGIDVLREGSEVSAVGGSAWDCGGILSSVVSGPFPLKAGRLLGDPCTTRMELLIAPSFSITLFEPSVKIFMPLAFV